MRWSLQLKRKLLEEIKYFLPEPQAGLVSGMVFGGTQHLAESLEEDLRTTGLTHVVSASGYNVSVVLGLGMIVLQRLPRWWATIGALVLILLYTVLASAVPPVVRAAAMSMLAVCGTRIWFRQYHPGYSLLLVTLGLLIWEPWYLHSLSFWLSVSATAGIVLILPLVEKAQGVFYVLASAQPNTMTNMPNLPALSWLSVLREAFLTTVAAQSFSAPLILAVFGELSILSLLTNTVLLWLTPLITLASLSYMVIGSLLNSVWWLHSLWVTITAPFVWLIAEVFLQSVKFFGNWQWGVLHASLSPWWVSVWWVGLLGSVWLYGKRKVVVR